MGEHITIHNHLGHGPSKTSQWRRCGICGQTTSKKKENEMAIPRSSLDESEKEKVPCPKAVTIRWLIERDACKKGMLAFLGQFPSGNAATTETNFKVFSADFQAWFREQINEPLVWEDDEFHRLRGLQKLTPREKRALGLGG